MMNFQGSCLGKGSQEGNLSVEICSREFFFKHALAHRMLYGLSSYTKKCLHLCENEKNRKKIGAWSANRTKDCGQLLLDENFLIVIQYIGYPLAPIVRMLYAKCASTIGMPMARHAQISIQKN